MLKSYTRDDSHDVGLVTGLIIVMFITFLVLFKTTIQALLRSREMNKEAWLIQLKYHLIPDFCIIYEMNERSDNFNTLEEHTKARDIIYLNITHQFMYTGIP